MTQRGTLWTIFAIVLLDMLGFGIVMPVLPGVIMRLGHLQIDQAAVFAGWLGAGYAFTQFICAPVVGNLSDRFGRRPVLLAAVLAMAIDYAITAFAPALWFLAIGRLIAGLTGASWSAGYAALADITPPEKRAANFGLMGMAFGFGFIAGPALGGLLATLGSRVPFLAASGFALAAFLFGLAFLNETLAPDNRRSFDWRRANAFAALKVLAGQSRAVLWSVAALGTWQLAHIVYPAIWTYFAIAAYGMSVKEVGIALAVVGFASALVQGVGLRFVAPRLGERAAVALGIGAFAVSAVLYDLVSSTAGVYAAIVVGSLQGFVQPSIQALNSRAIDARSQGELQGATQSIGSIAMIIAPPLYSHVFARFHGPGAIAQIPAMPLLLAAVFALAAMGLFLIGTRVTQADAPKD